MTGNLCLAVQIVQSREGIDHLRDGRMPVMAPMGWTLFRTLSVCISIGSRFPRALHLQINGHTIFAKR